MFEVLGFGAITSVAMQDSFSWPMAAAIGTLLAPACWLLAVTVIGLGLSRIRDLAFRGRAVGLGPQDGGRPVRPVRLTRVAAS